MSNRLEGNQRSPVKVTLFLYAFNQEEHIEEACRAALAQTYSPLEIIFSDDCSSDNTFAIMSEIVSCYPGPHAVLLNRNEINLGLIGHVNKSFELSSGELIVAAAGDDISLPDRVSQIVNAYEQSGRSALLFHSKVRKMDASGRDLEIWVPPVVSESQTIFQMTESAPLYIGATAAWSRRLYDQFGPIYYNNVFEDTVMGYRAALEDGMYYIDNALVRYRVHGGLASQFSPVKGKASAVIKGRLKWLQFHFAVYSQRLRDLEFSLNSNKEILRTKLQNRVQTFRMKIMFYNEPGKLFVSCFSKDWFFALKAFRSEITVIRDFLS